jgi:hypothetical protein
MKALIQILNLLLLALILACQPQAQKSTNCGAGQTFNQVSRTCASSSPLMASPVQQVPVNSLTSVNMNEDTPKIIYLTYSDANLDQAIACNVIPSGGLSAGACSCNSGSCQVTLTAMSNFFGNAGFTYTVTDNDGTSLSSAVNVLVQSMDDAPIGTLTGSVFIFEDMLTPASISYFDVEGDQAISCSIISSTNLAVATCNCIAGLCTAQLQGTANVNGMGIAQFTYQVYANGSFSLPQLVTVNITGLDDFPVGTTMSASTSEDTPVNVSLAYTDVELDVATSCSITSLTNLTVSTPCACSGGNCSVGILPSLNLNSANTAFSFAYTVTANSLTSFPKTVNVSVSSVDDAPVGSNLTLNTNEDTPLIIALPFVDPEGDSATSCVISNLGGGTINSCLCSQNPSSQCEVTFTPSANLATSATFQYAVTAGAGTSSIKTVNITLNPINDAPTSTYLNNLNANEGAPFIISFNVDEGGGTDENSQNLTITAVSDNPTLLPNGNISLSFLEAGDASDDAVTMTMQPVASQYGTSNITLQITDNGSPAQTITKNFSITVNPISAIHNGWKNLKAVGDKVNANGAVLENKSVTLEWEDFTIYGAGIEGYNVYRFTTTYSQDISQATLLNASPIPFGTNSYTDASSALAHGITYYYVVRPIDNVYHLPTASIEPATVAEIKMPDQNMALLHRWAVNKEICQKMGQTSDEFNHYRCPYNGPGATPTGYYDLGSHQFIDRFEAGCNYSLAPKCSSAGCIGNGNPNTVGCSGSACSVSTSSVDLFYDRSSGTCFYTTNGSSWSPINSTFTSNSLYAGAVNFAVAHLPPLSQITKDQAQQYCLQQGKRLITRKEFIAAAAWPTSLSENSIYYTEIGGNLSNDFDCNSSSGSGLTFTNGQVPPSASADTLPGNIVSLVRSVRSGSNATQNCRSKYGVQDLIGNLAEWSVEEIQCSSNQHCDTQTPSSFGFSTNTYNFDGLTGPMLDSDNDDIEDSSGIFSNWLFESGLNDSSKMFFPVGLPADHDVITGVDMIPDFMISYSIANQALHGDSVRMNADAIFASGNNGAMTNGGHYSSGYESGRYSLEFKNKNSQDTKIGFRCIKTAP